MGVCRVLLRYEFNATCHADMLLPVLRGAIGVFDHYLTYTRNGTLTDQLHVPDSALPNCGGGGWDNSYDLGAAHWGLGTFVYVAVGIGDVLADGTAWHVARCQLYVCVCVCLCMYVCMCMYVCVRSLTRVVCVCVWYIQEFV